MRKFFGLCLLTMLALTQVASTHACADITLSGSLVSGGSANNGLAFDFEVLNPQGIELKEVGFQIRRNHLTNGVPSTWQFEVRLRAGSVFELIDGLPAHRRSTAGWSLVGSDSASSPADARFQSVALTTPLVVGPGIYGVYIHADPLAASSTNGVVTLDQSPANLIQAEDANLRIFHGTSKGSLFGTTNNLRLTPGSLVYSAVPEPSGLLLLAFVAGACLAGNRRTRTLVQY